MTSEALARKIIEIIDMMGDDDNETVKAIEARCIFEIKKSEKIVSDVDKAASEYISGDFHERSRADFKAGAQWQYEAMMARAIETVVKVDAGGYPYVDRVVELYDYDKDIPLAKKGDRVKMLIFKNEEL